MSTVPKTVPYGVSLKTAEYEIFPNEILGVGGQGVVFKGKRNNAPVAIKIIDKTKLSKNKVEQQRAEIAILTSVVQCQHVVKLLYHEETEYAFVLVMELCHGDLSGYIHNVAKARRGKLCKSNAPPTLPEHEIAHFLNGIANGIKELRAHKIAHRDLKPGNLLLVRTISEENLAKMDEKDRYQFFAVKIGDLGFAKVLDEDDITATFLGTKLYMAPEIKRHHSYTATIDLFSIGIIIFSMIVGRVPKEVYDAPQIDTAVQYVLSSFDISHSLKNLINELVSDDRKFETFFNHPFLKTVQPNKTNVLMAPIPVTQKNTSKNVQSPTIVYIQSPVTSLQQPETTSSPSTKSNVLTASYVVVEQSKLRDEEEFIISRFENPQPIKLYIQHEQDAGVLTVKMQCVDGIDLFKVYDMQVTCSKRLATMATMVDTNFVFGYDAIAKGAQAQQIISDSDLPCVITIHVTLKSSMFYNMLYSSNEMAKFVVSLEKVMQSDVKS